MSTSPVEGTRAAARVLVVDDSNVARTFVSDLLRKAGYDVDLADSGHAAVELLASGVYDLVLTDLHMPQPDGFAVLESARARDAHLPVLIFTGSHAKDIDAAVRALRLGADDFLTKPLASADVLLCSVERALQKKRQREALKEAEERYRRLFQNVPIGLFRATAEGRLLDANAALFAILGASDSGSLPDTSLDEILGGPDNRGQLLSQLMRDGCVTGVTVQTLRRDGRALSLEISARGVNGRAGHPLLIEGSIEDVTERVRAEEERRSAQRLEAVGRLAGGVAHDFNNVLGIILGTVSLMGRDPEVQGRLAADLEKIRVAAERGARLTRQLLALSQKQILQPVLIDPNRIIRRMTDILSTSGGHGVRLSLDLLSSPVAIRVDPAQFEQILINLTMNANDALPRGGHIRIETKVVDSVGCVTDSAAGGDGGQFVRITVRDDGVGMAPATQARLFEPFFTTKGRGKGHGLGLSVVHGIVTQSGGRITVESESGKGSAFHVHLPLAHPVVAETVRIETTPVNDRPPTILIVEDDEDLRFVLKRGLRGEGYRVLEAANGTVALEIAMRESRPIDLLLTDIVVPGMGGVELAKRLKERQPQLAVLYISGYEEKTVVPETEVPSGILFVAKPFSIGDINRRIRNLLQLSDFPKES